MNDPSLAPQLGSMTDPVAAKMRALLQVARAHCFPCV